MPEGLQVFGEVPGEVYLDTSMRAARALGQLITPMGVNSGSLVHENLVDGEPFYFAQTISPTEYTAPIVVTFSGITLSWVINPGGNPSASYPTFLILYGVY